MRKADRSTRPGGQMGQYGANQGGRKQVTAAMTPHEARHRQQRCSITAALHMAKSVCHLGAARPRPLLRGTRESLNTPCGSGLPQPATTLHRRC